MEDARARGETGAVASATASSSSRVADFFARGDAGGIEVSIGGSHLEGVDGVVCAAIDRQTGKRVAIKKVKMRSITRAMTRILREVTLLRHLKHPDIVEVLNILLPPTRGI